MSLREDRMIRLYTRAKSKDLVYPLSPSCIYKPRNGKKLINFAMPSMEYDKRSPIIDRSNQFKIPLSYNVVSLQAELISAKNIFKVWIDYPPKNNDITNKLLKEKYALGQLHKACVFASTHAPCENYYNALTNYESSISDLGLSDAKRSALSLILSAGPNEEAMRTAYTYIPVCD